MNEREMREVLRQLCEDLDETARRNIRPILVGATLGLAGCPVMLYAAPVDGGPADSGPAVTSSGPRSSSLNGMLYAAPVSSSTQGSSLNGMLYAAPVTSSAQGSSLNGMLYAAPVSSSTQGSSLNGMLYAAPTSSTMTSGKASSDGPTSYPVLLYGVPPASSSG